MKTPLEKQLEKAYQIFNKDHERLREKLVNSVTVPQIEPEPEQDYVPERRSFGPALGEIIMDSRIFKIAAGIIIVGIVAIALKVFTGTNTITSVAFGDVLNMIHTSKYTFDITNMDGGQQDEPTEMMINKSGILRWDITNNFGGTSFIINLNTGDRLILLHGPKIAADRDTVPGSENMEEPNPFDMLANPVENLWNLQDGTETSLGEKEIDGQSAVGFRVKKDEEDYTSEINVWANRKTGIPIRVEIKYYDPQNPSEALIMVMSNFNLNVQLDEKLFSMKPPEGYTLANQKLEEIVETTDSSQEAEKILQSINFWSKGDEDRAIATMLNVDWTQSFEFSDNIYIFSMTEKEVAALNIQDVAKVMGESMETVSQIRSFSRRILELAEVARKEGKYVMTEKYLNTTLELGKLMCRDSEGMMMPQITGIGIQQKSLEEMKNLYTQTGNQEKLQQVQEEIKKADAASEDLSERAKRLSGG